MPASRPGASRGLGILAGLLVVGGLLALWPRSGLVRPAPTALLLDTRGAFLGEAGVPRVGDMGYWPLDDLPPRVVSVTLAAEDRRFWFHPGVDPIAILRALGQNWSSGRRISGASTLAMQVARMQHPGRRRWPRKLLEAATALLMTARHGRREILRQYLRLTPYGNRIRGLGYAARRYFGKPVADLGWAELAFLTALPQAPARRDPTTSVGRGRALARASRILDAVGREGWISSGELRDARDRLVGLQVRGWGERPTAALHPLLRMDTDPLRPSSGLVRTTLDLEIQREAQELVATAATSWGHKGLASAALLVVELPGGEVRAAVGSPGYFASSPAGAIDFTRVPRSSGSTLKPFVYAQGLEDGVLTPTQILDDLRRAQGGISNADDDFLGPLLPRVALANSRNVPVAHLTEDIGLQVVADLFGRLGLYDGERPAEHYGNGLALGTLPVRLDQLVGAYGALAAGGMWRPLRWFEDGPREPGTRVFRRRTARRLTRWLSDPMARLPTFRRQGTLEYPFAVAAKTGTSSRRRDAWCVAFSDRWLVGAWVGHPDALPMGPGLSGSGPPAYLVKTALLAFHRGELDGLGAVGFPAPEGSVPVRICAVTGLEATAACQRVATEDLTPSERPGRVCRAHRSGTGLRLPARYAEWAEDQVGVAVGLVGDVARGAPLKLTITSPEPGQVLRMDPEAPPGTSSLALGIVVDPPVPRLLWYVDGELFREVEPPYRARWPLTPGIHRLQAKVPYTDQASEVIRVRVLE